MDEKTLIISVGRATEPVEELETVRKVKTVIRSEELLLGAASKALKNLPPGSARPEGIAVGVDDAIDSCKAEFYGEFLKDGPRGVSPLIFPYTSPNAVTAQATIAFGIRGEDITIAGGPLSFLKAVAYANDLIKNRVLGCVLAAGVCERAAYAMVLGANSERPLSEITGCTDAGQPEAGDGLRPLRSIEDSFDLMDSAIKGNLQQIKAVDKEGRVVIIEVNPL